MDCGYKPMDTIQGRIRYGCPLMPTDRPALQACTPVFASFSRPCPRRPWPTAAPAHHATGLMQNAIGNILPATATGMIALRATKTPFSLAGTNDPTTSARNLTTDETTPIGRLRIGITMRGIAWGRTTSPGIQTSSVTLTDMHIPLGTVARDLTYQRDTMRKRLRDMSIMSTTEIRSVIASTLSRRRQIHRIMTNETVGVIESLYRMLRTPLDGILLFSSRHQAGGQKNHMLMGKPAKPQTGEMKGNIHTLEGGRINATTIKSLPPPNPLLSSLVRPIAINSPEAMSNGTINTLYLHLWAILLMEIPLGIGRNARTKSRIGKNRPCVAILLMTQDSDRHRHDSRTGDKRRYSPSPSKEARHPLMDSPTYKRRRRDSPDDHSTRGRSPYRDSQTHEPGAQYNQEQPRKNAYHQFQNQNRQQQPYHRQHYNNNQRGINNYGNNYQNNNHHTRNGGGQHRYQPHNHTQKRNRYDNQQRTDHYYKKDKDKDVRDNRESRDRGRYKGARDSSSTRTRSRSRSQSSSDSYRSGYSGRSRRGERKDRSKSRSQSGSRSPVEMKEKPKAGGMKHVRPPLLSRPALS